MVHIKKNIGMASAVVVGVLTIGGTAYAYHSINTQCI